MQPPQISRRDLRRGKIPAPVETPRAQGTVGIPGIGRRKASRPLEFGVRFDYHFASGPSAFDSDRIAKELRGAAPPTWNAAPRSPNAAKPARGFVACDDAVQSGSSLAAEDDRPDEGAVGPTCRPIPGGRRRRREKSGRSTSVESRIQGGVAVKTAWTEAKGRKASQFGSRGRFREKTA